MIGRTVISNNLMRRTNQTCFGGDRSGPLITRKELEELKSGVTSFSVREKCEAHGIYHPFIPLRSSKEESDAIWESWYKSANAID